MFVRAYVRYLNSRVYVCTSLHLAIASTAHQSFWQILLQVRVYGWTGSGTSSSTGNCTGSLAEEVMVLRLQFLLRTSVEIEVALFVERPFK